MATADYAGNVLYNYPAGTASGQPGVNPHDFATVSQITGASMAIGGPVLGSYPNAFLKAGANFALIGFLSSAEYQQTV